MFGVKNVVEQITTTVETRARLAVADDLGVQA